MTLAVREQEGWTVINAIYHGLVAVDTKEYWYTRLYVELNPRVDRGDLSFSFAWSNKEQINLSGVPTKPPARKERLNIRLSEGQGEVTASKVVRRGLAIAWTARVAL